MKVDQFILAYESKWDFKPQEGIFYYLKKTGYTLHLCPCGCRARLLIHKSKDKWIIQNTDNQITVTPSIKNLDCKSHYYIINNKVDWC